MHSLAEQQSRVFLTCDLVGDRSMWNEGDRQSGTALQESVQPSL